MKATRVIPFGLALLLLGQPGCSCNTEPSLCPAAFTVGERCPLEGLVCPWPESSCNATVCTCVNQPGGFYWKCQSSWCVCTCPCGYTARTSCETLVCSKAEDPCPPAAADVCAVACTDARIPDAGRPDRALDTKPVTDGQPDASPRDAGEDRAGDGQRDRAGDSEQPKPRDDLTE